MLVYLTDFSQVQLVEVRRYHIERYLLARSQGEIQQGGFLLLNRLLGKVHEVIPNEIVVEVLG